MSFFQQLNFSSSNEDGATELRALAQQPPRRLVCLTGSGSRVLDMTLGRPRELIALDVNPMQNNLLRLKMAAFRILNDDELLAYLGVRPCADRMRLHERVATCLEPDAKTFWQRHHRMIENGVWYAGLWEKVLRLGAKLARLTRGKNIDRLFAAQSLEEQANIWSDKFDDALWHGAIRLLGRRFVWTRIIGEPGGTFLPSPKEVESRLAGAFNHAAKTFFFRESDFASLILRGTHESPRAIPLHLQPENTPIVREQLDRIRIVDGGLVDLARCGIADVEAFSLSDFGSYCDSKIYAECWAGIATAAAPQALVCERIFMNSLPPVASVAWNAALSDELTKHDNSFIYHIRTGTFR